jgi:hypothetical protein
MRRDASILCALVALSLVGGVVGSGAALGASIEGFPTTGLIVRLLRWPGILGTAVLSIAMWYFWYGFDNSGWLKKAIWFLPLYFLLAIGPAFDYFFVYRGNDEVATCS